MKKRSRCTRVTPRPKAVLALLGVLLIPGPGTALDGALHPEHHGELVLHLGPLHIPAAWAALLVFAFLLAATAVRDAIRRRGR